MTITHTHTDVTSKNTRAEGDDSRLWTQRKEWTAEEAEERKLDAM